MEHESIYSSTRAKTGQEQLELKERNEQVENLKRIIVERDERIAFLERSILAKNEAISIFERQNHELLQKIHGCELTKREKIEEQMLTGLAERPDTQSSSALILSQAKQDEERFAPTKQISSLHQKPEPFKFEKSLKTSFSSDCTDLNVFWFPYYLAQELKNKDGIDVQRKNWAGRKLPVNQIYTSMETSEECSVIIAAARTAEGHFDRELYLSKHISEETVHNVLGSPLKSMSKEQLISHYIRVVAELRREKEILLAEKTEEIYRLKRNFLREGNDREVRVLKRKLGMMTRKLDEVIKENEKLSVSQIFEDDNWEGISKSKGELQIELRSIFKSITEKERELKALVDKLAEASSKNTQNSSREAQLLNQIAALESEKEDIDIKNRNEIDILQNFLEETVKEKLNTMNLALEEVGELRMQKHSLEDMIQDKDRVLNLALIEKEDQKKQIALMEKLTEEKENKDNEWNNSSNLSVRECEVLKKQNDCLENIILADDRKQGELKKQVVLLEQSVKENKHLLSMALSDLDCIRKQKLILDEIIHNKEDTLNCIMKEEEGKRKQLEAIIAGKESDLILAQTEIRRQVKEIGFLKESLKQKECTLERTLSGIEKEKQQKWLFEAQVQRLEDFIKNMQEGVEVNQKKSKMEVALHIRNIINAFMEFEHMSSCTSVNALALSLSKGILEYPFGGISQLHFKS
eukprot:Gb_31097 [translate_table: standard]